MKAIALAIALILSTAPVRAGDLLSLAEISDYFNSLKTVQAEFTQINDDGSVSTGRLYIHRPGRMRFEYDPPNAAVVLASGGAVVIHDPKSNQPPETYPLRRTPLSIILARTVNLDRADMVVGHRFDGTSTVVTAQDPENPEYGSIDLIFSDNPVELRKWVIRDDAGGETTVLLGPLQTGGTLSDTLFDTQVDGRASDR